MWMATEGASPPSGHVCPHTLIPISLLQHFFTSFGARDRCFLLIFRLWQNALLEKVGLGENGWGVGGESWSQECQHLGSWRAP